MAGGVGIGSRRRPGAGDRLCHRACRALDLDPDQSQGGAGHPYGCRGSLSPGDRNSSSVMASIRRSPGGSRASGFRMFPVADWATYALAMATLGCGLVICWLIALRVVDRRRAFFVVVMLALYPIFNFKGFKYNPDLLQLVTLPLLVLAYLDAFEKRSVRAGLWLGLAGALALMTKYWVLTMIGAIGIAALVHPDRWLFLRSPAPWVAIVTLVVAMLPHLWWLKRGRLRAADLCRRRLRAVEPRTKRSACARLYRPQSGAARRAGCAGGAGAGLDPAMVGELGAASAGAVQASMAPRPKSRRECVAGAQYLDHPDRGRDRAAARRPDFHGLYEDRLGNLAVLSDAAGAGCDSRAAASKDRAVSYRRDLAGDHARGACRLALHRGPRDRRESQWRIRLRRAFRTRPRADAGLASALQFAMGRGRRHHGDRRADDVLQPGSSGAVHARRDSGRRD